MSDFLPPKEWTPEGNSEAAGFEVVPFTPEEMSPEKPTWLRVYLDDVGAMAIYPEDKGKLGAASALVAREVPWRSWHAVRVVVDGFCVSTIRPLRYPS